MTSSHVSLQMFRTYLHLIQHCPPAIHKQLINFPRGENNVPLWAPIDLQNSAPQQVGAALSQFRDVLWGKDKAAILLSLSVANIPLAFAWGPKRPIPPTPISDIARNCDRYIDTALFTLPVAFDTAQAPDVYTLADYFAKISLTKTPFQL